MHITYLVHGFPPHENAGTEQHTAILAKEMQRRGHQITVISTTRQATALHGAIQSDEWNELTVYRIANNVLSLPLHSQESRPEIRQIAQRLIPSNTDILHVQHHQFMGPQIQFQGPMFWTLHDAWGWCPSGGTRLRRDIQTLPVCNRPTPETCANCYAHWRPEYSKTGEGLLKIAQHLGKIISAQRLHSLWKRIPLSARSLALKQSNRTPEDAAAVLSRNQAFQEFAARCTQLISPSIYLAEEAKKQGFPSPTVIPHGLPDSTQWNSHIGGNGLLFMGTMTQHKGPQIVEAAYLKAFPEKKVPILFVGSGPVQVSLSQKPGISREEVFTHLQQADVLVMGSIWPENYPMILLEAKAIGCPVIAPNIGGVSEIIVDGKDGLLYPVGNIEVLAEKMKAILQMKQNKIHSPPPTLIEMADQYERLYLDAIHST